MKKAWYIFLCIFIYGQMIICKHNFEKPDPIIIDYIKSNVAKENFLLHIMQRMTDYDIEDVYNTYIKPYINNEYILRYVPLPLKKNNLPWKWEGKDFARVIALLEFERFVEKNKICFKKALSINSDNDPEWYYVSALRVESIDYEKHPNVYDLHVLNLPSKDYDFVMVNQTLEHVYDPICCLQNIYDHMCPGAILYLNIPVQSIPHNTPFHHYTGFTSTGLGMMVKAAGFNILSIGQWGNVEYVTKMYQSHSWPDYRKLANPGINDFTCPVIAWIFAKK